MSRYDPLTVHLQAQPAAQVRMSFAEIEQVLGRKLPDSAVTHRGWWSNNASNNVMTRAWLNAGFRSEQVDLASRTLVFRRDQGRKAMAGFAEAQVPFTPDANTVVDKLALFGWMKGTITVAPGTDLTDPADPEWADAAAGP
jgi:hypothetical protein